MRSVLTVTDEPVIAEGFRGLVKDSDNLLLEPLSFDSENLGELVLQARPDVVLVNWHKDLSLTVLARFCSDLPDIPIILVARNPSPELAYRAQEAGCSGLLDSRCSRSEILSTLEHCVSGDFGFDFPQGMELRPSKAVRMSPREGQMVRLLSQGLKNKEIATCLGISEGTVKVYLSNLFKKVGAKDRFELALFGLKNMVDVGDNDSTQPAGSSRSPSRPNHVTGFRTLVLSEPVATDYVSGGPAIFNTRVNAAGRTSIGSSLSRWQPTPSRLVPMIR